MTSTLHGSGFALWAARSRVFRFLISSRVRAPTLPLFVTPLR